MTLSGEVARLMRGHGSPLGLSDTPADEYDCCAPIVLKAVLDHLREMTDDIAGSRLDLPAGRIWLHAEEQVDDWLKRMLTPEKP